MKTRKYGAIQVSPSAIVEWLGLPARYELREIIYDHANNRIMATVCGPGCFPADSDEPTPNMTVEEIMGRDLEPRNG